VHQNIESTKCFLSFGEKMLDVFSFRNIPLDRDGLSTFFCNLTNDPLRPLSRGCVINHHRRPFSCEVLCDASADAFRSARYNPNFPCQLSASHCNQPFLLRNETTLFNLRLVCVGNFPATTWHADPKQFWSAKLRTRTYAVIWREMRT